MSIADTERIKQLEQRVAELELAVAILMKVKTLTLPKK